MKRIVSLVLALSMILSVSAVAFAGSTLSDVAGTEYEASVSALVELGIVNGYEDGTYKPSKVVTRAEMAKLLVIASGLEKAADVAKGTTPFSDVPADHWATGYINVASQYNYINGYPDGTFRPDNTVTYAEAVTMAIRVLGYKSVVESKGTWPTNYIAKAAELKTLEDVNYNSYNDGAVRGNVAVLVWNMLRTYMWDVTGENDANGLNYGSDNRVTMIDKFFDEFDYADEEDELYVDDIVVKDGKVSVSFEDSAAEYELAEGVDFLDLFGRQVSCLYNNKDEKIVMIAPISNDKVVEGFKGDLEDDKYTISGDDFKWGTGAIGANSYVKAVIDSKKVTKANTIYAINSEVIVKEVKEAKNDKTSIIALDDTTWKTLDDDTIVLIDGEWASPSDIKEGDVVSELVASELYIVSRDSEKGAFEAVTNKKNSDEDIYYITVDGKDYKHIKVDEVVEVDEDGDEVGTTDLIDIQESKKDDDEYKFYDQDCTLFINFLGEVIRIEFEEIPEEEAEGNFYVLTNGGKTTWTASDENDDKVFVRLNGEKYEVKSAVDVSGLSGENGSVVFAKFDSKDRVKSIYVVGNEAGVAVASGDDYTYTFVTPASGEDEILDEHDYAGDIKVNDKTVVVTIKGIEDEEDDTIIDHYEVSTSKGAKALEGVEAAIIAVKDDPKAVGKKATYVFVWEDAKNTEKLFGIVTEYNNTKDGIKLTIKDAKEKENPYDLDEDAALPANVVSGDAKNLVGTFVAFTENDGEIKIAKVYNVSELEGVAKVVNAGNGRDFELDVAFEGNTEVDLDVYEKDLEDYQVIFIKVSKDIDTDEYSFTDWDEISYSAIKVAKKDRFTTTIVTDPVDAIIIMRGIEE